MCIRVRCKECGRVYKLNTDNKSWFPLPVKCECGHQFIDTKTKYIQIQPMRGKRRRPELGMVGCGMPMSLDEWLFQIYARVGQKFIYTRLPSDLKIWGLFQLAIRVKAIRKAETSAHRNLWKIEDRYLTYIQPVCDPFINELESELENDKQKEKVLLVEGK